MPAWRVACRSCQRWEEGSVGSSVGGDARKRPPQRRAGFGGAVGKLRRSAGMTRAPPASHAASREPDTTGVPPWAKSWSGRPARAMSRQE